MSERANQPAYSVPIDSSPQFSFLIALADFCFPPLVDNLQTNWHSVPIDSYPQFSILISLAHFCFPP